MRLIFLYKLNTIIFMGVFQSLFYKKWLARDSEVGEACRKSNHPSNFVLLGATTFYKPSGNFDPYDYSAYVTGALT